MKKLLVVGGSYFLGRVFVEEALASGRYELSVLNRGTKPIGKLGVEEIVCDRHDEKRLGEVLAGRRWDVVIDFCAYTPHEVRSLIESFSGDGFERYIYISSAAVHKNTFALPICEDHPTVASAPAARGAEGEYAQNKLLAEQEVAALCPSYTIVRPVFVAGKYNYAPRESYFFHLLTNELEVVLPDGVTPLFSMVSVWDVARILLGCLESEKTVNGAFIASASELVSYELLLELMERITGKRARVSRRPMKEILTDQLPLPFALKEHLAYSGEKLRQTLGISYAPLAQTLERIYPYYLRAHGLSVESG